MTCPAAASGPTALPAAAEPSAHVNCLARLSQALRMRPDRGEHPAALGRADMEAFMHRLAYLESAGQITRDCLRSCREVRHVLTRTRASG